MSGETVKHIVMLQFKDELSPEQKEAYIKSFHDLASSIEHIKAFEWGTDVSVENRHQGFTHVFVLTFDSHKARDGYLVHPAHEAFANELLPALEKVVVVDYQPSPVKCGA